MITHNLIPGTPEWLAYRETQYNASDSPAMMAVSPYKTRSELLRERAIGFAPEIDARTQQRFDAGHRFERLARPLAEEIIGEDLYPVVGSIGKISASFDGLNLEGTLAWEHKTLNDAIRAAQTVADLDPMYHVQMEQQLYVSGAERCLFMASLWTADDTLIEEKHFWYESDPTLRAAILVGWDQFECDLLTYEHVEVLPAAVAAPVKDLPALSIRIDGQLTLQDNLVVFGAKLREFVADINTDPQDDQAFADAEAAVKVMERAETALGAAEASALGQVAFVDEMVKTVATYKELARKTRLMLEKLIKTRKETLRVEIQQEAKERCAEHTAALNARLGKPYMPPIVLNLAEVMKGKRTITSLRDAADTEVARFKIESNATADKISLNLTTLRELAAAHSFLFSDAATIVLKAPDDLTLLVKSRIADHERAEEVKAEALRAKIREEERIKAEAAAKETARLAQVEADRVLKAKLVAENVAREAQAAVEASNKAAAERKAKNDALLAETESRALAAPVKPAKVDPMAQYAASIQKSEDRAVAEQRFHRPAAPVVPAAKVVDEPRNPGVYSFVALVSEHYGVSMPQALEWLRDADFFNYENNQEAA